MSNRTIKAPGVEIFEHDMSEYPAISEGTHVLIAGFAQKGEDYTPYRLTSRSSWLKFYGAPTNEAEEYFYTAANTVFDQGGYLYSVKIPYTNDIRGIYAAAKFRIEENRELYKRDPAGGYFVDDDGEMVNGLDIQTDPEGVRLVTQYSGLKDMGINKISKICPQGQDFLSYDTVEEYESGESKPSSNTIYVVDKTRAIYTRATKVHDTQENRDARSCLGIVPVFTTMANTAWFQRKSTGLKAPINELYQPIRSIKTITFPAGAASAAEYQPTSFVAEDFSVKVLSENSYERSLAETAAMQAQSCLLNGNMVDGKFAPGVCNDVALIIFKAFVSTEDGKIDFDVVEQFVGSLDPESRNDRGVSDYLPTIVNNNSDYVYMFANLRSPRTVCTVDHAFVAGSNSNFDEVAESIETGDKGQEIVQTEVKDGKVVREIKRSEEYGAATAFSAYTARMLGFDGTSDQTYSAQVNFSLQSFYNQDEKEKCAMTDELEMGDAKNAWSYSYLTEDIDEGDVGTRDAATDVTGDSSKKSLKEQLGSGEMANFFAKKDLVISKNFIISKPACAYTINQNDKSSGRIQFGIISPKSVWSSTEGAYGREDEDGNPVTYMPDAYEYKFAVGRFGSEKSEELYEMMARHQLILAKDVESDHDDVEFQEYKLDEWLQGYKIFQLSIFNSTDYLKALLKFEDLIDVEACANQWDITVDASDPENNGLIEIQDRVIRRMIVNSMEKTAKFKYCLRQLKKARAALNRLDDTMATVVETTSASKPGNATARAYVRDLYSSLLHMGVLNGIDIVAKKEEDSSAVASLAAKSAALERQIEGLVNPDTSKKEKAEPTKKPKGSSNTTSQTTKLDQLGSYPEWYIKCRVYLRHKLFMAYKDMYTFLTDTLDTCAWMKDRYLQSQQMVDDSNIMLGFYPEMAEPIITYTEIAQSLNKMYDTFGDLNSTTVDVVCDAGLSNIAQFVKQVYDPSSDDGEDVGGRYEPVRESYNYKFNKFTDISFWKTIVMKFDTFCKSIRKDCMFVTECPRHLVLNGNKPVVRKSKKDTSVDVNIIPYLTKITGFNTSYGAGYMNWYKTVSDYTGDTLWVPPSIVATGTYILTDRDYNWWDAPAGQKRGVVSMSDVSFNPNMRQAGEIYDVAWNYAVNYQGEYINGIIQEGQKTFQSYRSAFDRVNVRRLFLRCERYVYFASRAFLYEPNTAYTRRRYVDAITPFFEDIKNRGGMYDYIIICDESNNTPDTIDRNELRVKIGIQPVKTIEFIIVDFVATRTGSDWSELATI